MRPALVKALINSGDRITIYELYKSLCLGAFGVGIVAKSGEPCGALVVEAMYTKRGPWLSLPFAGLLPSEGAGTMLKTIQLFEDTARQKGFVATRLFGSDARFASLAKRRGYEPGYVEYVKEF